MRITGTFIDEISHDIPHHNWGKIEWDRDFSAMKSIGIDTVIVIRCGHGRFITYPSEYLINNQGCYRPPVDLLELFLDLAEKYEMNLYLGLYDSRQFWINGEYNKEIDINRHVAEEVWKKYGHKKSFKGWYINQEVGRFSDEIVTIYSGIGKFVKDLSGNLNTMISPFIHGSKAVGVFSGKTFNPNAIKVSEHEREWERILDGIEGSIDIVAFQDGHCDYHELEEFLTVNKALTDKHNMHSWTNSESFDRDMPIKFLPIKWEKMLMKLEAAKRVGMEKAITFEFSHFLSPNSMYTSAHSLFERYKEYFNI